ncbi:MAG: LacI family DNA-binding transcriptional regulator [Capsulimonadaceae bacterium]|nr:LacI family DNA-binding transcriptional regulator [Capsulimonadaceae bacterium]
MTTISDIAKACGTSKTTVSLVMNGNDRKISREMRERVLETVKRMDYQPSALARGLSMQRAGAIGIWTPEVPHILGLQYYASIIAGIVDEAAQFGLTVTLFSATVWKRNDSSRLIFSDGRCDGLIMVGIPDFDVLDAVAKSKLPCVVLHGGRALNNVHTIDIDNIKAGYDATRYLVERGHRRIGFLHADETRAFSIDRFEGYRNALSDCGIDFDPAWSFVGNNASEMGYEHATNIVSDPSLALTALFCATDLLALGAIQGLRDAGVRVPADMSVIGIDGMLDGARSFPKLTTLDQSLEMLGVEAARTLMGAIENPDSEAGHTVWQVHLVERESVCVRTNELVGFP